MHVILCFNDSRHTQNTQYSEWTSPCLFPHACMKSMYFKQEKGRLNTLNRLNLLNILHLVLPMHTWNSSLSSQPHLQGMLKVWTRILCLEQQSKTCWVYGREFWLGSYVHEACWVCEYVCLHVYFCACRMLFIMSLPLYAILNEQANAPRCWGYRHECVQASVSE